MFQQFFNEDVCLLIISELERYAWQKLHHDFNLSPVELDTFLGTILFSRYCLLPQEWLYWCNNEGFGEKKDVEKQISGNKMLFAFS